MVALRGFRDREGGRGSLMYAGDVSIIWHSQLNLSRLLTSIGRGTMHSWMILFEIVLRYLLLALILFYALRSHKLRFVAPFRHQESSYFPKTI